VIRQEVAEDVTNLLSGSRVADFDPGSAAVMGCAQLLDEGAPLRSTGLSHHEDNVGDDMRFDTAIDGTGILRKVGSCHNAQSPVTRGLFAFLSPSDDNGV